MLNGLHQHKDREEEGDAERRGEGKQTQSDEKYEPAKCL